MALQKQNLNIPFSQGLDQKTDPKQLAIGKFALLQNVSFGKNKIFNKRNGYQLLTTIPETCTTVTTYNGNLIGTGKNLYSYSPETNQWLNKGNLFPLSLNVQPLVRSASAQQTVDIATTSLGIVATAWKDSDGNAYYQIVDGNSGNIIVSQTQLPSGAKLPRIFSVGRYFVITFLITITGTTHLRYIAVPISMPGSPHAAVDISTQVLNDSTAYDGQVIDGQLYIAWNASDIGGAVRITYIDSILTQHGVITLATTNASAISICGDVSGMSAKIWLTYVDSANNTHSIPYTTQLAQIHAPIQILTGVAIVNLTSTAQNSIVTVFYEISNTYGYSAVRSDYLRSITCTTSGTIGTPATILRSVGLASKAFLYNSTSYLLTAYNGSFQPTYFLIDGSGNIVSKLAYSNGGGYPSTKVLSNTILNGDSVQVGYLFKDQVVAVNKSQNVTSVGGVYSQTGINVASFTFLEKVQSIEIASSLHLNGGFLRMYDGVKPVEHNFHLWPEDVAATTASVGGLMTAQKYFYQWLYEWTDAQGMTHRSAPSVALEVDLSSSMTATNEATLNVPTLRVTDKVGANKVRIVGFRWSEAQQSYYQITSITSPILNDTTTDSIQFIDTLADSAIIGNPLIYTTGGVVENIAAPACNAMTIYKNRLMLIDAEDQDLIWYSKQVLETTPVEMSDLFTQFVSNNVATVGSSGPLKCLFPMDDKLLMSKQNLWAYMTGNGPDNTGANNDFSEPIFITSTVGCERQDSITLSPRGIMFQSDKGRWLLDRGLGTSYLGAPVEDFNSSEDLSALSIPDTNEVRITLSTGSTLVYDYYFDQWGEFVGVDAISATIYQNLHTLLDQYGRVFQETPGQFLDGANPVLIGLKSGWINLAGVQGYQRSYFMYFLGEYFSPHTLQVQIAYDYDPAIKQTSTISPDNFSAVYGDDGLYGSSSPYGGIASTEWWRIFFEVQKCTAFQISLNEHFDSSFGTIAGAGLTLSGINLVVGAKSGYPRLAPKYSVG